MYLPGQPKEKGKGRRKGCAPLRMHTLSHIPARSPQHSADDGLSTDAWFRNDESGQRLQLLVAFELRRNERRFFVGGGSLLHGTGSWMSGRYDGWARFCNRGGRRIRTAAWRVGTSNTYKVHRCNAALPASLVHRLETRGVHPECHSGIRLCSSGESRHTPMAKGPSATSSTVRGRLGLRTGGRPGDRPRARPVRP